jgi:hypothetical protein
VAVAELTFESILSPIVTAPNVWQVDERAKAAVNAARAFSPVDQAALAVYAAGKVAREEGQQMLMQPFLSGLLRKKLPFDANQTLALVEAITEWRFCGPLLPVLGVVESQPLTAELRSALLRLRAHRWMQSGYSDVVKPLAKIDELLGTAKPEAPAKHGPWTRQVFESVSGEGGEVPLRKLLASGASIAGAKPTKKWLAEASQLVDLDSPIARPAPPWRPTPSAASRRSPISARSARRAATPA